MTTWQRDPRTLWRRSGRRIVLSPPGTPDSVLLTGTGAITWQLLDAPITHDELTALLAESFAVEPATVADEVGAFLDELARLDAVIRS